MNSQTFSSTCPDFLNDSDIQELLQNILSDDTLIDTSQCLTECTRINSTDVHNSISNASDNVCQSLQTQAPKLSDVSNLNSYYIPSQQPIIESYASNSKNLAKPSKRKRRDDWRDQVTDQLAEKMKDPNFCINKLYKVRSKPKPYDRFVVSFQLE